jgi:hypothetical protein
MSNELKIAAFVLAVFIIYVVVKVRSYMRQSDSQWQQVDKSQLKRWEEDE